MTTTQTLSGGKQASVSPVVTEIQKLRGFVEQLISSYFPKLAQAPNIIYVYMAILGFESGWKLLHQRGLTLSSMHYSFVKGSPQERGAVSTYLRSPIISNLLNSPSVTPTTIQNIYQGCVAHGLSATMGYYYVQGSPASVNRFGQYPGLVSDLSLLVQPGQPITSLFQSGDDLAKKRSLASGLVILETDYSIYLKSYASNTALARAVGSYLGAAGVADKNGLTPEQRIVDVLGGSNSVTRSLSLAGISLDGSAFVANSQTSGSSSDSSNDQTRSASTSSSRQSSPGCTA